MKLASLRPFASFAAFIAGLASISAGAWLVAPAAGLVTAGVLAASSAIAYERHSSDVVEPS